MADEPAARRPERPASPYGASGPRPEGIRMSFPAGTPARRAKPKPSAFRPERRLVLSSSDLETLEVTFHG